MSVYLIIQRYTVIITFNSDKIYQVHITFTKHHELIKRIQIMFIMNIFL